jgi:hypothetical protein
VVRTLISYVKCAVSTAAFANYDVTPSSFTRKWHQSYYCSCLVVAMDGAAKVLC